MLSFRAFFCQWFWVLNNSGFSALELGACSNDELEAVLQRSSQSTTPKKCMCPDAPLAARISQGRV